MRKTVLLAALLFVLTGGFYFILYPKLGIITGYTAKIMCSCRFVSQLPEDTASNIDLGFGPLFLASVSVDEISKTVTSSVWGLQKKQAVYRQGIGCTLVSDKEVSLPPPPDLAKPTLSAPLLHSNKTPSKKVAEAAGKIFHTAKNTNTRAVVILRSGKLIFEQYASGIDSSTKLLGWSMSKSLTSALAGILVKEGKWQLDEALDVQGWQNDSRNQITLRNALNMTTGLLWEEDYSDVSDATVMLYASDTMGAYAASRPLHAAPGTKWQYSSGTTNLLSWKMRDFFDSWPQYLDFPHSALLDKIGATSFVLETDPAGAFVGSSYCYATARDWAKLGQLYLNRGNWNGEQILDTAWIEFTTTPAPDSKQRYGGHFWLNADNHLPNCPKNMYYMDGFQGQRVFILPDEQLVIVRLGVAYEPEELHFDEWVAGIIEATANSD